MSVTSRQFNHLKAMGIQLWQRKTIETELEESNIEESTGIVQDENALAINFKQLSKSMLFIDILTSLNLDLADVESKNEAKSDQQNIKVLDLGLITWEFIEHSAITFSNNTLTTPSLTDIAQSPTLKATLWQAFYQNNL